MRKGSERERMRTRIWRGFIKNCESAASIEFSRISEEPHQRLQRLASLESVRFKSNMNPKLLRRNQQTKILVVQKKRSRMTLVPVYALVEIYIYHLGYRYIVSKGSLVN